MANPAKDLVVDALTVIIVSFFAAPFIATVGILLYRWITGDWSKWG